MKKWKNEKINTRKKQLKNNEKQSKKRKTTENNFKIQNILKLKNTENVEMISK